MYKVEWTCLLWDSEVIHIIAGFVCKAIRHGVGNRIYPQTEISLTHYILMGSHPLLALASEA